MLKHHLIVKFFLRRFWKLCLLFFSFFLDLIFVLFFIFEEGLGGGGRGGGDYLSNYLDKS